MQNSKIKMTVVFLIISIVFASLVLFKKPLEENSQTTPLSSSLILGNPQGTVEIIQFTDFQCPACIHSTNVLKKLIAQNSNLKVQVFNYPLSSTCNKSVEENLHPWSCFAAMMALCSQEENVWPSFYNLVYQHQDQIKTPSDLVILMEEQNLPVENLLKCSNLEKNKIILQNHIQLGDELEIQGTPTLIFKGKIIEDWSNLENWNKLLN